MTDWVLRIEGVNLGDTVFNTNDLSTIRGSSLVLEAFGYELTDTLIAAFDDKLIDGKGSRVEIIYRASAQAAFLLKNVDEVAAQKAAGIVRERLRLNQRQDVFEPPLTDQTKRGDPDEVLWKDMPSEHMTFTVVLTPVDSDERSAVNRAMLISRRQQMAAPNLPRSPGVSADASIQGRAAAQCWIDPMQQIIPVESKEENRGDQIWLNLDQLPERRKADQTDGNLCLARVSRRVAHLRKYGRDARQSLYRVFLGEALLQDLEAKGLYASHHFAESFHDLVADRPDKLPEALKGKIACLATDGSGFSKLRGNNDIRAFAEMMMRVNRSFLHALVGTYLDGSREGSRAWAHETEVFDRKTRKRQKKHLLRMETMLTGGDDTVLVMPAWLAMEMSGKVLAWLNDFGAKAARELNMTGVPAFRAGLAIADWGTPFRRISGLAGQLCTDAKRAGDAALSIQIIEGQDLRDSNSSLSELRGAVYHGRVEDWGRREHDPVQVGAALRWSLASHAERMAQIGILKQKLAKSQLHRLIAVLDEPNAQGSETERFEAAMRLHADRGKNDLRAPALRRLIPGDENLPMSLRLKAIADLWDYIDPLKGA